MKILHFINTFPTTHKRTGGAENACMRIVRRLSALGAENIVATAKWDTTPAPGDSFSVESVATAENFLGPFARFSEVLKWYLFQFDPVAFVSAVRLMLKHRPDVVHMHNVHLLTFAVSYAAKMLGLPTVFSIYDYWPFCPLSTLSDHAGNNCRKFHGGRCLACLPPRFSLVQKILLFARREVFDFFLNETDAFVVLSSSSEKILEEYGLDKNRIFVLPLAPPEEFLDNRAAAVSRVENTYRGVLFIGWLQKRKGAHVVLDAMEKVWKKFPSARLNMIVQDVKWENDYKDAISAKLSRFDKMKYELVRAKLPSAEIKKYILAADVVVIPEQWENMSPLLLIEALSAGRPTVASDIGGIPEFVRDGETALLAEPSDASDFAEKIMYFLGDPARADKIGAAAADDMKRRAAGSSAAPLVDVYKKICEKH